MPSESRGEEGSLVRDVCLEDRDSPAAQASLHLCWCDLTDWDKVFKYVDEFLVALE